MNPARMYNIGHFVHIRAAGKATTFESGAYVSGTSVSGTGYVIDRQGAGRIFMSCKVGLAGRADLASGKQFDATLRLQHSSATAAAGFANLATGGTRQWKNCGTSTSLIQDRTAQLSVDLRTAKRYLRVKWTHYGSANTATGSNLNLSPVIVFGGADETPASAS